MFLLISEHAETLPSTVGTVQIVPHASGHVFRTDDVCRGVHPRSPSHARHHDQVRGGRRNSRGGELSNHRILIRSRYQVSNYHELSITSLFQTMIGFHFHHSIRFQIFDHHKILRSIGPIPL